MRTESDHEMTERGKMSRTPVAPHRRTVGGMANPRQWDFSASLSLIILRVYPALTSGCGCHDDWRLQWPIF